MSGSAETPHVVLVGDETRRLVEAIRVVADISGTTPTVVGGIAVLCRVHSAYRATADLDTLDRHGSGAPSLLELLRASPGAEAVEPAAAKVATLSGPVRVDVIDVIDVLGSDRQAMVSAVARVAEPGHSWR